MAFYYQAIIDKTYLLQNLPKGFRNLQITLILQNLSNIQAYGSLLKWKAYLLQSCGHQSI